MLSSPIAEVQLAALVSGNETVGSALISTTYMGKSLVSQVSWKWDPCHLQDLYGIVSKVWIRILPLLRLLYQTYIDPLLKAKILKYL